MDKVGEMLRSARERAGLTQEAAAKAADLSRVVLAYYETDYRQVPLTVAAMLARLYGTSLEGLLAGGEQAQEAIDVSGVLFRAAPRELSDQAQAGMRLFGLRLAEYVELAAEMRMPLPGSGRSPLAPPGTATVKEAASAARSLRHYLNLGGAAIPDPFQALDEHVLIWRLPLGDDLGQAPSGFFYNHPQAGFCIAVNSRMTLGRQVFTLAHELAHAYFHSHDADVVVSMSRSDQARERFADVFAGEFLVPGDELRRVSRELAPLSDLANPVTVIHLQRHFGVSFATLRARLLQEKMITRAESGLLADTSPSHLASVLGYKVHPADLADFDLHPLAAQPARVRLLVSTALEKAAITMGDAAEVLGTSTEEIRQLLSRAKPDNAEMRVRQDLEEAFFANLHR